MLAKARDDLKRLERNPLDRGTAMDFFNTVRNIPEWLYPDAPAKITQLFDQHVELRTARHLADGSKHFIAKDRRHKQVKQTGLALKGWALGAWADNAWGQVYGAKRSTSSSTTLRILTPSLSAGRFRR